MRRIACISYGGNEKGLSNIAVLADIYIVPDRFEGRNMRRTLSVAVLILSMFFITVVTTAYHTLNCGSFENQDFINKLQQGRLWMLLFAKQTWANYPSFPAYRCMLHIPTFLYAGFLILCTYYFLARRRKWRLVYVGLLCLAIGLISCSVRLKILLNLGIGHYPYSASPDTWGRYSAMMFIELVYSSAACAVFAILGMLNGDSARLRIGGAQ